MTAARPEPSGLIVPRRDDGSSDTNTSRAPSGDQATRAASTLSMGSSRRPLPSALTMFAEHREETPVVAHDDEGKVSAVQRPVRPVDGHVVPHRAGRRQIDDRPLCAARTRNGAQLRSVHERDLRSVRRPGGTEPVRDACRRPMVEATDHHTTGRRVGQLDAVARPRGLPALEQPARTGSIRSRRPDPSPPDESDPPPRR